MNDWENDRKSQNKHREFVKGKFVRIFNYVQFLQSTDYNIFNHSTGLQKGIRKEIWEVKKIVINKIYHWVVQIIDNLGDTQDFKRDPIWRISLDVIKKVN